MATPQSQATKPRTRRLSPARAAARQTHARHAAHKWAVAPAAHCPVGY